MNATDLARYLADHNIAADLVFLPQPTPTVPAAAEAVGVAPDQIVKSVLFMIRENEAADRPVLVIGHGTHHIDRRKLAQHLQVGRKRVRLADAAQVLAHTGYPAGTVPPFGHPQPLPTLMAAGITRLSEIYTGGGEINALLHMTVAELQRVLKAEIVELT